MPKIYKIVFSKKAEQYFNRQAKEQQQRLAKAISMLPEGDTKKLKGYKEFYRIRVGDYRIIYTIKQNDLIIAILAIGNRGEVYKK